MNVVLFGATGMVGQGVLREAILDPDVKRIVSIGRSASAASDPKVQHVVHKDMWNFAPIEDQLKDLISRTGSYRVLYAVLSPLWVLGDRLSPRYFTNTEKLGRAMLKAAKQGAPKAILESADINALAS